MLLRMALFFLNYPVRISQKSCRATLGVRNGFSGSVLETGKYLISGSLRTRAIQEPYDAILTVEEGRLYGGLITRHGCWEVTGVLSGESGHPAESEL